MTATVALLLALAAAPSVPKVSRPDPAAFSAYWNQGKAEITSFTLEQARYGEVHPGHAVLVYVTEPFSRSKQVKLDYARGGPDQVQVLKLNAVRKFNTGIYPYSTMRSIFTPADGSEPTIKVTTSVQEWCGHVFMQLNRQKDGGLRGPMLSYFESEGDGTVEVPAGAALEDDIWTLVRVAPDRLPIGKVSVVPSTLFLRLRHVPVRPVPAEGTLVSLGDGKLAYRLTYSGLDRTLDIHFEAAFPHRILGWTETHPSGFGSARRLTTKATRKAALMTDYWSRNGLEDRALRERLGLPK